MTKAEKINRLVNIEKALELALNRSECDDYLAQANITHDGQPVVTGSMWKSIDDLLDWYKEESK